MTNLSAENKSELFLNGWIFAVGEDFLDQFHIIQLNSTP